MFDELDGLALEETTELVQVAAKLAATDPRLVPPAVLMASVLQCEAARARIDAAQAAMLAELDVTGAVDAECGLKTTTWLTREAGLSTRTAAAAPAGRSASTPTAGPASPHPR